MVEIASAWVTVAPSAKNFGSSLGRQVTPGVTGAGKSIGRTFGKMFVLGAGVIAAAGIGKFLTSSVDEAREAQKVGAATEAIIKATGGAAKVTADQVGGMSERLSLVTGIDDEAIQTGANLLLTFKNVKNFVDGKFVGTFDRATAAAVDLSAAGFGSIDSASKTMGKALQDPVKGITALSRAGVTFTDQQKEQIKTMVESGDVLGAQNIILKEVEGQVGGVAEATATSGDKAKVAFGNLKEQIGTALLPTIDKLATVFSEKIAPAISGFISGMQSGEGAGGRFAAFIREKVVPALVAIGKFVRDDVIPAIQRFAGFVRDEVIPRLQEFGSFLIEKVVPAVRDALGDALDKAKSAFNTVRDAIKDNRPQLEQIAEAFKKVGKFILTKLLPFMVRLQSDALPVLATAIGVIIDVAGFWVDAFHKVKSAVQRVGEFVAGAVRFFIRFKDGAVRVVGNLIDFVKKVPGKIKGFFTKLPGELKKIGGDIIQGLVNGIKAAAHFVTDAVQAIIDKIPKKIRELMHIGSPSKVTEKLGLDIGDGLAKGIAGSADKVGAAAEKLGKKVKEKVAKLRDQLATVRSDFASLAEPIASAFTGNLFDFDTAALFTANLASTKAMINTLIGNFKTLKDQGLSPGFLYQLFQSGGPQLIAGLAGLPAGEAAAAGALFGDVMDLSSQLGTAVAGSTDKGAALETQTVRLEKKLDKLIKHVDEGADRTGAAVSGAAVKGHRRGKGKNR